MVCMDGLNQHSSAKAIESDLYQLGFSHPSFGKPSCLLETSVYPFLKPPYQSFAFQTVSLWRAEFSLPLETRAPS